MASGLEMTRLRSWLVVAMVHYNKSALCWYGVGEVFVSVLIFFGTSLERNAFLLVCAVLWCRCSARRARRLPEHLS